jgi:hypothetical protein
MRSGFNYLLIAVFWITCSCSSFAQQREFSIYQEIDLYGNDLGQWLRNSSLGVCTKTCSENSSCQAFTFNSDKKICILKSGNGNPNVRADAVSGSLEPIGGLDYLDDDLDEKGTRGISVTQCRSQCIQNKECRGFSYSQPKRWCFLKQGVLSPVEKADVISWTKYSSNTQQRVEVSRPQISASESARWGAVAMAVDGASGTAWNERSQEEAERIAASNCAQRTKDKCLKPTWIKNGAWAAGVDCYHDFDDGKWRRSVFWRWGPTAKQAIVHVYKDAIGADVFTKEECKLTVLIAADGSHLKYKQ